MLSSLSWLDTGTNMHVQVLVFNALLASDYPPAALCTSWTREKKHLWLLLDGNVYTSG